MKTTFTAAAGQIAGSSRWAVTVSSVTDPYELLVSATVADGGRVIATLAAYGYTPADTLTIDGTYATFAVAAR